MASITSTEWRIFFGAIAIAFIVGPYFIEKIQRRSLSLSKAKRIIRQILDKHLFDSSMPEYSDTEFTFKYTIKYASNSQTDYYINCYKADDSYVRISCGWAFSDFEIGAFAKQTNAQLLRLFAHIRLEVARGKLRHVIKTELDPTHPENKPGFHVWRDVQLVRNFDELLHDAIYDVEAGYSSIWAILAIELPELSKPAQQPKLTPPRKSAPRKGAVRRSRN
ncbi:MAG: hypothetical protein HUU46_23415 [Candidatus Hydrogenedentes bacterium]|nr:hypothetical protein [Candidatus Hydrogenedentota bacterium]